MTLAPIPDGVYTPHQSLLDAISPDSLIYFLLSVGNADTQVIVLPEADTVRHVIIVDIGRADNKVGQLLDTLTGHGILGASSRVRLLVVTHPHQDHVGGVPQFLKSHGDWLDGGQVWDPAYYHTTGAWHELMHWLEEHPRIDRTHPTAGTRVHIGTVAVTALSPSVRLRNHFGTYNVKINNASISMLVEFPFRRVFEPADGGADIATGRSDAKVNTQRLLLGADAQTTSWAHVEVDFNRLARDHRRDLRLLGLANGKEPLAAEIFKVPHHGSKNGVNHELVLRIRPKLSLISCDADHGSHAFPHDISVELLRGLPVRSDEKTTLAMVGWSVV